MVSSKKSHKSSCVCAISIDDSKSVNLKEYKLQNIDIFNFAALEILHQCIDSFPVDLELESGKIAIAVAEYFESPRNNDESCEHFAKLDEICMYTLWWLRDEGFIRAKNETDHGSCSVVISQKGLNAINRSPSIIDEQKSFKDFFKDGLASLPFNVASGMMTEFFK